MTIKEKTTQYKKMLNMSAADRKPHPSMIVAMPLPEGIKVSFEFFPPANEKSKASLWECIEKLSQVKPSFVSVTYGAGGTTRERTHETVVKIAQGTNLNAAAHLTCVGSDRQEIDDIAKRYWQAGIRHIVALRGDVPEGEMSYKAKQDGYTFASDLVLGLKKVGDFEISVAAYPESHPESKSPEADIDNLKRKIDAGATRAITQYFFEPETYLRFLERIRAAGIHVPIVPGILPVTNITQVKKFSKFSGTTVPAWLTELFDDLDDNPEIRKLIAASVASEQCRILHASGVNDFHFYTLNCAALTYAICHILGVRK